MTATVMVVITPIQGANHSCPKLDPVNAEDCCDNRGGEADRSKLGGGLLVFHLAIGIISDLLVDPMFYVPCSGKRNGWTPRITFLRNGIGEGRQANALSRLCEGIASRHERTFGCRFSVLAQLCCEAKTL